MLKWDSPKGTPLEEPMIPYWGIHAFPEGPEGIPLEDSFGARRASSPMGPEGIPLEDAFGKPLEHLSLSL